LAAVQWHFARTNHTKPFNTPCTTAIR
jgi:hypothetical protein